MAKIRILCMTISRFERCVVWCLKTYALAKTALAMDNDLHEYGKKRTCFPMIILRSYLQVSRF